MTDERTERLKILFVDDEPAILQGLNRMLFSMRKDWEMVFASGGEAALNALAAGGYHMLVTDLNMPGMDGVTLLREVRQRYPQVIRIILSGSTQSDTGLQTVQLAHQYLAKPCNADELKDVIGRTRSLRAMFRRGGIMATVAKIETLPSAPGVYEDLLLELASDKSSAASVGEIISRDAGMCAKVLQLVNSAFFGLRKNVRNPAQAVNYLGMETVKALVLSVHIFQNFGGRPLLGQSLENFMEHCVAVAQMARAAVRTYSNDKVLAEHAFLGGLLHDTGKLVLAQSFPGEYDRVLGMLVTGKLSITEAEYETFGATHAEVGAYLLGLWGLPDPVLEALAYHHAPVTLESRFPGPAAFVHIADVTDHSSRDAKNLMRNYLDYEYLRRMRLPDDLGYWKKLLVDAAASGAD